MLLWHGRGLRWPGCWGTAGFALGIAGFQRTSSLHLPGVGSADGVGSAAGDGRWPVSSPVRRNCVVVHRIGLGTQCEVGVGWLGVRLGFLVAQTGAAREFQGLKLVESAQARGRAVTGAHLVPLVRAGGGGFENGVLGERKGDQAWFLGSATK